LEPDFSPFSHCSHLRNEEIRNEWRTKYLIEQEIDPNNPVATKLIVHSTPTTLKSSNQGARSASPPEAGKASAVASTQAVPSASRVDVANGHRARLMMLAARGLIPPPPPFPPPPPGHAGHAMAGEVPCASNFIILLLMADSIDLESRLGLLE